MCVVLVLTLRDAENHGENHIENDDVENPEENKRHV